MSVFKTRLFYGGVLVLALVLCVSLSKVMIENNLAEQGLSSGNEYVRKLECMRSKDTQIMGTSNCERFLV